MKALVYTGPETLELRDAPDAAPREGEVVVAVDSVGICGSDMHGYLGHDSRRPAPLILGHEAAGVVTGDGRRVTVNPLVSCGTCAACRAGRDNICAARQLISMPPREGAFAERVAMPPGNLVAVPDGVALEKAALVEPIACGWHAVRMARAMADNDLRTLVIGGGAIGVGAALSANAQGIADVIVLEPLEARRHNLRDRIGLDAREEADLAADAAFDLVVDAVGIAVTRALASRLAAPGGVIAHIGLGDAEPGLDVRRLTLQEIAFLGTYTYTMQDFRDTAAAMWDGRLGTLDWIETRPLADGARAFEDIRAGRVEWPKIILKP